MARGPRLPEAAPPETLGEPVWWWWPVWDEGGDVGVAVEGLDEAGEGDGVDGASTTVRANNTTWCPADIWGQSIATLPSTGCTPRYSPSS